MQFSTVASFAAVAAVATAASNSTDANVTTEYVSDNQTTLVTITSCEDHACSETVSTALVSTATVTENGVVTEYTTWCPLSSEEAAPATVAPHSVAANSTSTTHAVSSYEGAAVKALPAGAALLAGAAALLL
ncbi:hypothetical protein TPHA_0A01640 [Tetrapisispora phaffii CBS 4417]|uniref:Uncharacterized protein n=1 Tax=Tetrapisispora phaffii (strain ATCC 24235 / CBS 4417 / NBRC 1672 / NRRL Y-8282 / UCD 70-5) TaxID=1071381 RepID=G8BMW9_TETPH|nr:hypothetical protein TPHA_0A01640 [Tetrapisispora phaffii CBS 4417]CCE61247.1 hypothetical protein TPHA_0A01640 [Tetrapisispora phaffii CBS 4417]